MPFGYPYYSSSSYFCPNCGLFHPQLPFLGRCPWCGFGAALLGGVLLGGLLF